MPRVLLIFPTSIQTCRWMLRGILRYGHRRGPRELHIIGDREGEQKLKQIREWGVTGMIGYVHNKAHAVRLQAAFALGARQAANARAACWTENARPKCGHFPERCIVS